MHKVLILDDEKPVRQAVILLGKWDELGVGAIYEAVEGQAGLAILREKMPDIVLVDMKMPNMSGIDFLKIASKGFPMVKYIVISGYDDFEYTKEAIKSKAVDYLLKPVNEDELNRALKKAVDELDAAKASELLMKQKIAMSVIDGNASPSVIESFKNYFWNVADSSVHYGIAILNGINLNEVCKNRFNGDMNAAFSAIASVADECWSEGQGRSFSFKSDKAVHEMVILLSVSFKDCKPAGITGSMADGAEDSMTDGATDDTADSMTDRMKRVIERLKELFGLYSIVSIGGFYPVIGSLCKSYKHAGDIFNNINLLDNKENVFTSIASDVRPSRISFMDKKEILIYAFENGSIDFTKRIIDDYFASIKQEGYFSLDDLSRISMEFMVIIRDIATHLKIPCHENIIHGFRYGSMFSSFTKIEDFSGFVYDLVGRMFEVIRENLKICEKENLTKIKDYIDRNYYKEIKLSMFSEKYYLSKEYLSKLFKDEFGYSIYEYVLKIRMEKAKEMLMGQSVKIQTISEHLGYKDNNYFSRAFKSFFGLSPSEYRESLR